MFKNFIKTKKLQSMQIRYKNYSYGLFFFFTKEVKEKGNAFKKGFYLLTQDFCPKVKGFPKNGKGEAKTRRLAYVLRPVREKT